jgi:hypothetical protein
MDASDVITLQAFLLALPQLDVDLPGDLHQAIQDTGRVLANHQPGVANEIRSLVKRHARLDELYEESYRYLLEQYQAQDRVKRLNLVEEKAAAWEEIAASILTAEDFTEAARNVLKRMKQQIHNAPGNTQIFLLSLHRAVEVTDARSIAVLKALEKRPLTVKGLVYVVGLSLDQAWVIVRLLWKEGYIDRVTSNIFYKIFPMLKNRQRTCQTIRPDTYLTLTAKGHFFLHPVVTLGGQKGIIR